MRAGILTVSDRSSRGERKDASGPALLRWLEERGVKAARLEERFQVDTAIGEETAPGDSRRGDPDPVAIAAKMAGKRGDDPHHAGSPGNPVVDGRACQGLPACRQEPVTFGELEKQFFTGYREEPSVIARPGRHVFDEPDPVRPVEGQRSKIRHLVLIYPAHDHDIDLNIRKPARSAASIPSRTRRKTPPLEMRKKVSGRRESRLILRLSTPAALISAAISFSNTPLVVRTSRFRPGRLASFSKNPTIPFLTSGSPPVTRIFSIPRVMAACATRQRSS
jgi:hypothetical protein